MTDPAVDAWREALAESNTDLLDVVARMDRLREQLARVTAERDDALVQVASCARDSWIVARDGGRDCERCEQEIRRGVRDPARNRRAGGSHPLPGRVRR